LKFGMNAPKNWEKNISTLWTWSVFKEDCEALLVQIHDIYYMEKLIPDLYIIFWGLLENKYCKRRGDWVEIIEENLNITKMYGSAPPDTSLWENKWYLNVDRGTGHVGMDRGTIAK
jgi:hypothetical protein